MAQSDSTSPAWSIISVVEEPRLDASGHAQRFFAIKYHYPARNYNGIIYMPIGSATESEVRNTIQADVARIEGLYSLTG